MYIPLFNKSNYTLLSSLLKIDDICNGNYDMRIEDGGFNLSSGERQRVIRSIY